MVLSPAARVVLSAAMLGGVFCVLFALGVIAPLIHSAFEGGGEIVYGMPSRMKLLLGLPLLGVALTAILVYGTFWVKAFPPLLRLHLAIVTAANLLWVLFLARWHFLGWRY